MDSEGREREREWENQATSWKYKDIRLTKREKNNRFIGSNRQQIKETLREYVCVWVRERMGK